MRRLLMVSLLIPLAGTGASVPSVSTDTVRPVSHVAPPRAAAPPSRPAPTDHRCTAPLRLRQVLIYGDSITARTALHYDRGETGWFEYAYRHHQGRFRFSALGRSRYASIWARKDAPTFYARLGAIRRHQPRAILIAGGVLDGAAPDRRPAIRRFYTRLATVLARHGIPACSVYAFVPRPRRVAATVPPLVRRQATAIGARYVDVTPYPRSETYDGLHPTSRGAWIIWRSLLAGSDLGQRLR